MEEKIFKKREFMVDDWEIDKKKRMRIKDYLYEKDRQLRKMCANEQNVYNKLKSMDKDPMAMYKDTNLKQDLMLYQERKVSRNETI